MQIDMLLGNKSKDNLEPVYVFAPCIPVTTIHTGGIPPFGVVYYSSRKTIRKIKINKLLNLGLNIDDEFSPRKSISSRYSTKNLTNNFYQTVEINKPTS